MLFLLLWFQQIPTSSFYAFGQCDTISCFPVKSFYILSFQSIQISLFYAYPSAYHKVIRPIRFTSQALHQIHPSSSFLSQPYNLLSSVHFLLPRYRHQWISMCHKVFNITNIQQTFTRYFHFLLIPSKPHFPATLHTTHSRATGHFIQKESEAPHTGEVGGTR